MRTKIDVRRAIKERFGTISAFCEQTGLRTQNIIQNIIKGNPSIKKLVELCEKMDCDITDLFYPIDEAGEENNTIEQKTEIERKLEESPKEESMPQHTHLQDTTAPLFQIHTAICPSCGKQVRVGVVMLPDVQ